MKIGIVAEYLPDQGTYHFAEEAEGIIDYIARRHSSFILHPGDAGNSESFPVINARTRQEESLDLSSLDSIYFGVVGKSLHRFNQINCLSLQLQQFCNLLESLSEYPATFVNPPSSMVYNMSKQYILDFSDKTSLPFVETEEVGSLEQLIEHARSDQKMIAKPLISERANGMVILNRMNEEELSEYAGQYLTQHIPQPGLYHQVMAGQGIIVQPYMEDFRVHGEKKLAVVDGQVTIPRINEGDVEIVTYSRGATIRAFKPTADEADLAVHAFNTFNRFYPVHFMRVDMIGSGPNLRINELEVINPDFATMDKIFSESQHEHHYRKILDGLERGAEFRQSA